MYGGCLLCVCPLYPLLIRSYCYIPVVSSKTILDSRPNWTKSRTVFRPKRRKNPTLWGRTHLYGLHKGVPPGLFLKPSPLTPLQKGLNLGWRPNPLFHLWKFCLCVCHIIGVSWPGRDLKQWAAANSKCIKKIRILQKLTYLSARRGFFCPFFSMSLHGPYRKRISHTETTDLFFPATSWKWHSSRFHSYLLCLSSLRRSRDICLIIYLCYIFILYIYFYLEFWKPGCLKSSVKSSTLQAVFQNLICLKPRYF